MSEPSPQEAAQTFVLNVVQAGLAAIKRGDVEVGSSLLEGMRSGIEEPSMIDTWKALALIESGDARSALMVLADGTASFGWARDRREATRALAMRSLNMPGWQAITQRILSGSGDSVALTMASRIEAWH